MAIKWFMWYGPYRMAGKKWCKLIIFDKLKNSVGIIWIDFM